MEEFKELEELEKMLKKLFGMDVDAIFYGFSRIVKPDGTEEVVTFGNVKLDDVTAGEEDSDNETPVDVIVDSKRKEVVVTAELPGFEMDDIKVKTAEKQIEIRAEKDGTAYRKTLPLEVEIEPKSTKIMLNKGVLEIKSTLKKQGK